MLVPSRLVICHEKFIIVLWTNEKNQNLKKDFSTTRFLLKKVLNKKKIILFECNLSQKKKRKRKRLKWPAGKKNHPKLGKLIDKKKSL